MSKGYLILAHGRTGRYYQFAANLAASMKAQGVEFPICLLTDQAKPPLSPAHLAVFDQRITIKKEDYLGRKIAIPFYTKTLVYNYSPFDATIYLDADGWATSNPDKLFTKFKGRSFQTQVRGVWDFHTCKASTVIWSDPQKLYARYNLPHDRPFVEHNSSLIYFEKCDLAKDIFRLAEYFYSTEFVTDYNHQGFFHYPDELAFSAATMAANHRPQKEKPIWFKNRNSGWDWPTLKENREKYCFFGLYGANGYTHPKIWDAYKKDLSHFHQHRGQPPPFKLTEADKIAGKSGGNPRYKGLKPFEERPDEIQQIIDRYG